MKKLKSYIQSAWYNIRHNKAYALFCVFGTALTFVFITLVLQLTFTIVNNNPPFANIERIITFRLFENKGNKYFEGIAPSAITTFMSTLKGYERFAITNSETGNVFVNSQLKFAAANFTDHNYWSLYQYKFTEGRCYNEQEIRDKKPVAVVSESFARTNFRKDQRAAGQEFEFQGNTYTIIGVIKNFSAFHSTHEGKSDIWIPYTLNKFTPSYSGFYWIKILVPTGSSVYDMKRQLAQAVQFYFTNQNKEVEISPESFHTEYESNMEQFGGNLLVYGVGGILFILLVIPALNIITLNVANANKRQEEIAVRRAIGSGRFAAFSLVMAENLFLVITGTILGLLLTVPVSSLMEKFIFMNVSGDNAGNHLMYGINYRVLLGGVFPLCLLFSVLSGGWPSYMITKQNIAETLKGGSK